MKYVISLRLIQHTAVTEEATTQEQAVREVVAKLQLTYDKVEVIGVQEIAQPAGSLCDQIAAVTGFSHEDVANHLRNFMEGL